MTRDGVNWPETTEKPWGALSRWQSRRRLPNPTVLLAAQKAAFTRL